MFNLVFLVMRLIILLFLILASASLYAQNKRNTKIVREYHDSGMLKKVTVIKTFERAIFEPGNYYKRTKTWVKEYYANGKPKLEEYKKTWLGTSGNGCYETIHTIKEYNEQGQITLDEETQCDKGKVVNKFYNNAGKVTFIRINYYLLEG